MTNFFAQLADAVQFDPDRMTKADLFHGSTLMAGINCFEPGQSQVVHSHVGADKFYLVISGKARMIVGEEIRIARGGTLVVAPAGVSHGVLEALERTVMLIAMAPPPPARSSS
ncbi:MAG: cupin domain-containing protein [Gemmatimonadota bacterium]